MAPARKGHFGSVEERLDPLEGIEGVARCGATPTESLATGLALLDAALEGGLAVGSVAEFVSAGPSCGGQSVLLHLLEQARLRRRFAALVDAAVCFDPESAPPGLLEHLLWARCRSGRESLRVADALLRDENLEWTLLDLRGCPERELRRLGSGDWYRLQRLAERSGGVFCVFTPFAMVPAARTRVVFERPLGLALSEASGREIGAAACFRVERLGRRRPQEFPNLIRWAAG